MFVRPMAPSRRLRALLPLLAVAALLAAFDAAPALAGTGSDPFIRGDANSDGAVDIGDAISVLGFLFSGGSAPACMDAADANDDGSVDIGDAISILGFLFSGAGALPPPFPAPGVDPTPADPFICGDPCLPAELCNGIDDDCDGDIDEDATDATPWYPDVDQDGFGRQGVPPLLSCVPPPDMASNDQDCDDDDPEVFPGGTEICDGEDDDCDGTPDDSAIDAIAFYPDADGDLFGDDSAPAVLACTAPPGHVVTRSDCDDSDPSIHPGGTETCDGEDEDCDGTADDNAVDALPFWPDFDGDGFGAAGTPPVLACTAPPAHVGSDGDCDDADDSRYPGAPELCDGEDDDCDGTPDDSAIDAIAFYPDADGDLFGDDSAPAVLACTAPPGHVVTRSDCDDSDPSIHPGGTETCDGEDEDCDGTADDNAVDALPFWPDGDADGFGDASAATVFACTAPPGHVATREDCDDGDATIHPGATESCDGVDQDCDGIADEVALGDFQGPRRAPAAVPRAAGLSRSSLSLDLDDPDLADDLGRIYGMTIHTPLAECHEGDTDLVLPGVGTDFVFARRYRSRRASIGGPMGHQWEHSYEIRAHLEPDGLHLFPGDHREDVLVLQPDGVTYAAVGVSMVAHFSGVDIFVEFGNGGVWRLEPRGGGGGGGGGGWRIAEITDLHSNELIFSYDSGGRLANVLDTVGRVVTFTYDASGRITALADGTGRVWSYSYYAPGEPGGSAGDLKSVTTPAITGTPTGNDFPLGRTTTYTYTSGHADDSLNHDLLTITDPRGNVRVEYEYDLDPMSPTPDALVARVIGGARWTLHRQCADPVTDHGAVLRVIGNDDRGAVTEMFFDPLHRCVMRRDFTGFAPDPLAATTATTNRPGPPLRPSDPPFFETLYEWNDDHRLTRMVHPDGNETECIYEVDLDPAALPLARTNLRQVIRTPGTHPGGGTFPALVDSYEVQPGFGGFAGHEFRVSHTNPRAVVTVTVRDAFGNALQVQRPVVGSVEDFEYDSRGRLTAHVRANHDATGLLAGRRRDVLVYPPSGPSSGLPSARIVDITGVPQSTSFVYNPRGHLLQVVHPSGNSEFRTPNALGELVLHLSRIIASGTRYETRCFYDANGNRVRVDLQNRDENLVVDPTNPWLTRIWEYDERDHLSRVIAEEGSYAVPAGQLDGAGLPAIEFVSMDLVHDVAGRLLLERSGVATSGAQPSAVIAHEYDERDLHYRATRAPGTTASSTTEWGYSANGATTQVIRFGFGAGPRQTTSFHDGYDRLVSVIDAMGNERSFEYDENGNVTRTILHGELADLPGNAANIRMEETEYAYDALDRRISSLAHRFDPATQTATGGKNENWIFTGGGHLLTFTDDSGDVTEYEYDSAERLHLVTDALGNEVELSYDLHSNVLSELHRDLSSVSPGTITFRQWTYAYDGLDRRISSSGPLGETRTWSHAWHGVGKTIDERGNVERIVADSLGRVIRSESDLTSSGTGGAPVIGTAMHHHAYDENGRRVLHTDPNGHATTYEYDALDRLVRTVRADGTEAVVTYDAHDDPLSVVDPNGTLRSYQYDALSRRISSSILAAPGVDPSATFEAFTYDARGRIRTAVNDDASVFRSYDSLGYDYSETIDGLTTSVATDDEGHPTLVTYPSGRQIAYASDALGRTHQVSEGPAILATLQYLGPCCLEWMSTSNGITTEYSYDLSRRLVLVSGSHGSGSTVLVHSYGWDPAENLVSRTATTGSLITNTYQYDSLDRLVVSQASSPIVPPTSANYQLDTAGNRLFVGGFPSSGPYFMDPTLPAPADAQMHQYTQTPTDQRLYTAAGELSVVTSFSPAVPPTSYHYDGLGRLRSREEAGTAPIEYEYDALGRRIRALIAGTTSRYVYLVGGEEIAVHDAVGNEVESSIYAHGTGGSLRIGMRRVGLSGSPEDLFFHHDSAGSIVLLTDSSGAVVESYDYGDHGQVTVRDPLGNPIPSSQVGNAHLFHGYRLDTSGRIYLVGGNEFLDPDTGRMLSSLDNDTGAIDFVRWGAVDVPPGEYAGGNPTSGRQRLLRFEIPERNLTPEQSQILRAAGGPRAADLDRDGYLDVVIAAARTIPDYLDPDDDGDSVPTMDEDLSAYGAVPRSGSLAVVISGEARAGLRITGGGGGGGGGGGCAAGGAYPRDSTPIIRGSALGNSRFRDDPYAEDAARARSGFSTFTPGHKSIDPLRLSAATGSVGKPVRDWIHTSAKGKNIRKNISVTLFKSDKSHGREGKEYLYLEAWPCRWKAPELSAASAATTTSDVVFRPIRVELK